MHIEIALIGIGFGMVVQLIAFGFGYGKLVQEVKNLRERVEHLQKLVSNGLHEKVARIDTTIAVLRAQLDVE